MVSNTSANNNPERDYTEWQHIAFLALPRACTQKCHISMHGRHYLSKSTGEATAEDVSCKNPKE